LRRNLSFFPLMGLDPLFARSVCLRCVCPALLSPCRVLSRPVRSARAWCLPERELRLACLVALAPASWGAQLCNPVSRKKKPAPAPVAHSSGSSRRRPRTPSMRRRQLQPPRRPRSCPASFHAHPTSAAQPASAGPTLGRPQPPPHHRQQGHPPGQQRRPRPLALRRPLQPQPNQRRPRRLPLRDRLTPGLGSGGCRRPTASKSSAPVSSTARCRAMPWWQA